MLLFAKASLFLGLLGAVVENDQSNREVSRKLQTTYRVLNNQRWDIRNCVNADRGVDVTTK